MEIKCAFSETHFIWKVNFNICVPNGKECLEDQRSKAIEEKTQTKDDDRKHGIDHHVTEIKGKKRSMKLLQQQRKKTKTDCIVLATVNYGSMIEAVIMCDFGLDDSNQEDTFWFITK